MRDIVNSSYNSATLPTKNKLVRMNSSGTVKTDYRSYRGFLESYGSDKNFKDDQESVSSTDSGISSSYKLSESKSNNTSTSSLNSEINGNSSRILQRSDSNPTAARTGSFKNYLESYNNKKFSSVKPTIASKQNLIKSELVIQVNDPLEQSNKLHKTNINGDIQNKNEDKTDAALHIFPRPPVGNHKVVKLNEPQHAMKIINGNSHVRESEPQLIIFPRPSFGNPQVLKPSTLQHFEQVNKNTTNGNLALQEEPNSITPPPPPPFPPPQVNGSSINYQNDLIPPPPPPPLLNLNNQQSKSTTGKKWDAVKVDGCSSTSQEKQLPVNDAAANLAKILTQHLLPRRRELERLEENKMNQTSHENDQEIKNQIQPQNQKCKTYVQVMPNLPQSSQNKKPPQIPRSPPPQLPQSPPPPIPNSNIPMKSSLPSSPTFPRQTKTENPAPPRFPVFSPTMSRRFQTLNSSNDPKPRSSCPAMFPKQSQNSIDIQKPSTNFENALQKSEQPKLPQTAPPTSAVNGRNSPNSNGNLEYSTTTVVPVSDSTTKVSKKDPNVRKLVYNTYRGLLGAYNNKANDMIATLPRNMVREDKGISKQLESMSLQGGLEKLNGRTNPNVEQE